MDARHSILWPWIRSDEVHGGGGGGGGGRGESRFETWNTTTKTGV